MASCQWKSGRLMIKRSFALSHRMAGQAGIAFVIIATYTQVLIRCFLAAMACGTRKYSVIVCIRMALGTLIPYTIMCPAIDWEVLYIMIAVFST